MIKISIRLAAALAFAAPLAAADDKALAGKWTPTALTFDGDEVPAEVAAKLLFAFRDGKVTLRGGLSKLGDRYIPVARQDTYKVALGADGKAIDLVEARAGGRTIPGLYKLEGDKLTLCLNFKNGDRPDKFESKADSGIGLYVMEKRK
jgi:uncharacterized protein (TIGR03067 family)